MDTNTIWITSIASGIAGIIGKFLCYPFDTIKAQLYVRIGNIFRLIGIKSKYIVLRIFNTLVIYQITLVTGIYHKGGIPFFYKGALIAIFGSGPAFSLYITSYEIIKLYLTQVTNNRPIIHLMSGLLAEAISGSLWLPIDVVKERLQVQAKLQSYNYSGSINAVKTILKEEGLKGLYKGYGATLSFFGPYSALYFYIYEKMKELTNHKNAESKVYPSMISAGTACLTASLLTQPLAVSKLRLQVQYVQGVHSPTSQSKFYYQNIFHGIQQIYQHEGYQALFRGYSMRITYVGIQSIVSMTTTEWLKSKILTK